MKTCFKCCHLVRHHSLFKNLVSNNNLSGSNNYTPEVTGSPFQTYEEFFISGFGFSEKSQANVMLLCVTLCNMICVKLIAKIKQNLFQSNI